jgi:hypothetical protein
MGQKASEVGFWVSKPGQDVFLANSTNMLVSSTNVLNRIITKGTFNVPDGPPSNIVVTLSGLSSSAIPMVRLYSYVTSYDYGVDPPELQYQYRDVSSEHLWYANSTQIVYNKNANTISDDGLGYNINYLVYAVT